MKKKFSVYYLIVIDLHDGVFIQEDLGYIAVVY
jgi:hypothetical protein